MTQKDFKDFETKCIKCNKPFTVYAAEMQKIQQKGLILPKRCPNCGDVMTKNAHKNKKCGN